MSLISVRFRNFSKCCYFLYSIDYFSGPLRIEHPGDLGAEGSGRVLCFQTSSNNV